MHRPLHPDEEIALPQGEATRGVPIAEICASAPVSLGTFHHWRRRDEVERLRSAQIVRPLRPEPDRPL